MQFAAQQKGALVIGQPMWPMTNNSSQLNSIWILLYVTNDDDDDDILMWFKIVLQVGE